MAEGTGKKKQQKMSLSEFIGGDGGKSWADAPDDDFPRDDRYGEGGSHFGRGGDRYGRDSYGSGDRYGGGGSGRYGSDRPREPLPVPESPPFIAYVGNLAYGVSEGMLQEYFSSQCDIEQVRIVRDFDDRSKGFGYIHFVDKQSLELALTANNVDFEGRVMRVDVASQRDSQGRSGFGDGAPSEADTGPWRRGDKLPAAAPDSRDSEPRSSFGSRPAGPGGWRGEGGMSRDYRDSRPSGGERPRLNLKPRSSDAPTSAAPRVVDYSKAKSNPFGDAKPRDEAAYQRKKELERQQREADAPKPKPAAEPAPSAAPQTKKTENVWNRFAALKTED